MSFIIAAATVNLGAAAGIVSADKKEQTCSSKRHGGKSCKNQPLSPSSLSDELPTRDRSQPSFLQMRTVIKKTTENKQPPRTRRKQLPRHTTNMGRHHSQKKFVIVSSDESSDQKLKDDTTWVPELQLHQMDKHQLDLGSWLTDKHISTAQTLLKDQFPHINGL